MKRLSLLLSLGLVAAGCSSSGQDLAARLLAANQCAVALAAAGIQVLPVAQGVKGAEDKTAATMQAIATVGASNLPAVTLAACGDALAFGVADLQAAAKAAKEKAGKP